MAFLVVVAAEVAAVAGSSPRQSVRAIVVHDGKLLLMKRNKYGQEFYALVGGGIDKGDTPEEALIREVQEVTQLDVANPRLVMKQSGGAYGEQFIFTAEYVRGEPALSADSEEAQAHAQGENLYEPVWLPVEQLAGVKLLPAELQPLLLQGLANNFSSGLIEFSIAE